MAKDKKTKMEFDGKREKSISLLSVSREEQGILAKLRTV